MSSALLRRRSSTAVPRAALVTALGAAASPPALAQLDPAPPAASDDAPTTDLVRARFPAARGWFRLVEGARFERDLLGRLVPSYEALTHPRVRRADAAGFTVMPAFPTSFDGAQRIALGGAPELWVDVTPVGARAAPLRLERGVVVYPDAFADTDVLYKATPTHVDEYLLLRSPAAPSRWRFALRRSPALPRVRAIAGALELLDAQGRARLRAAPPFAVDARGERRTGTLEWSEGRLELSIDLRGLAYPVLVDPDWSPTGDMAYGRFYFGANALPDGSVLATGGCSASVCSGDLTIPECRTAVQTAERLDPTSRTWTRAGNDPIARFFHTSQSLRDGSVLVTGGCLDSPCDAATTDTQVFSARERTFAPGPALSEARAGIASALLDDGTVLLAGGAVGARGSAVTERFDPSSRTLRAAGPLHTGRGRAAVTVLRDGRVLVVGGCVGMRCERVLADAEVYDPSTDRWTVTSAMSTARGGHYAVTLRDGRVLVGGGCPDATCSRVLASTELFDPRTLRFTEGPPMRQPRVGARAVRLPNGGVLVSQGCQTRTGCDLSNELFEPEGRFAAVEDALTIRGFHELVLDLPVQQVVAVGGCQPRTCSWWNETYDLSTLRPLPDPVLDAGVEAGVDAAALDALGEDAPSAEASLDAPSPSALPEPAPSDAASARDDGTPPATATRCGCRTPGAPSKRGRAGFAFAALALASTLARRVRRAS